MTIKEIAKMANVSLGTVDRVIHNRGKVSKKTEKKVLSVLEKVNYEPNIYARGLVLNKTFTIAALVPSFEPGEYWQLPREGIKKAAQDFKQFGISIKLFEFDQNSPESFSDQAEEVLRLKPDGVILAPVINFEARKLSTILKSSDIPFILIDSNIKHSDSLSFIGQDAYQSGRLAARLLNSEINFKGYILIISIKNGRNLNPIHSNRIDGFREFFDEKQSNAIIFEELDVYAQDVNLENVIAKELSGDNINGAFVPSSEVYHVAKVIKSKNLSIKLVGFDLLERNITYLENYVISYLIGQRPYHQGYTALETFYKFLVLKQDVTNEKFLPLDIITFENFKYYDHTSI